MSLLCYKNASNLLCSLNFKMSDSEMEMDDFDLNEEEQQPIIPPRRVRQSVIQFVEAAARIPPTYTKEEALRRYAQEKIKREKLLKQRRDAENRIKHFINKMKRIEEELNRSDEELAILEPIVLADMLNPN